MRNKSTILEFAHVIVQVEEEEETSVKKSLTVVVGNITMQKQLRNENKSECTLSMLQWKRGRVALNFKEPRAVE